MIGGECLLGVAPTVLASGFALCDMSLEGPTIGMCFSSREIGPGPVELVFEVKIVFANALSLSLSPFFFFFLIF